MGSSPCSSSLGMCALVLSAALMHALRSSSVASACFFRQHAWNRQREWSVQLCCILSWRSVRAAVHRCSHLCVDFNIYKELRIHRAHTCCMIFSPPTFFFCSLPCVLLDAGLCLFVHRRHHLLAVSLRFSPRWSFPLQLQATHTGPSTWKECAPAPQATAAIGAKSR